MDQPSFLYRVEFLDVSREWISTFRMTMDEAIVEARDAARAYRRVRLMRKPIIGARWASWIEWRDGKKLLGGAWREL